MTDPRTVLTDAQVSDASLADWTHADGQLAATFATRKFTVGLDLVNRVGAAAEAADHHPDITLTYGSVTISMFSHDVNGITSRDINLAREITAIAADLGIASAG